MRNNKGHGTYGAGCNESVVVDEKRRKKVISCCCVISFSVSRHAGVLTEYHRLIFTGIIWRIFNCFVQTDKYH
jgi:hypothetical protein